jgi:hypothetical protein
MDSGIAVTLDSSQCVVAFFVYWSGNVGEQPVTRGLFRDIGGVDK